VTLWYDRRFLRALQAGPTTRFDLEEVLAETGRRSEAFDAMLPGARMTYQYTTLPESICLGAYAIAFGLGLQEQVEAFVSHILEPADLPEGDPARLLVNRFRRMDNQRRRRHMVDDWTILVRALNLHIQELTAKKLQLGDCWPRVAEPESDFNRRRMALSNAHRLQNDRRESVAKKAS
jgi:hypothetical protein